MNKYRYLTYEDRQKIEKWYSDGVKPADIAEKLKVHTATVYIKEVLHIKYYLRYMDDMVLFGRNKKELHRARKLIAEFISPMGLTLKENWQVFKVDARPVDLLGFRFYRDRTTLRRRNALRIRRRVKKAYRKGKTTVADARAILSYLGWIKHSNSRRFFAVYIKPYINIKKLKEVVSNESRKQYQAVGVVG